MNAVLVLNQDYTPLTVCSAQRAFLLVFLEKAELVNSLKNKKLRSITTQYPFPSVIKVNRYIRLPFKGVVLTRHNIFKRDGNKCQYCGTKRDLTLDHLIPRSRGGDSSWTNLVTACKSCNTKKGDSLIGMNGMKLRNTPSKPSYIAFLKKSHGSTREDWKPYLNPKRESA